MKAYLHSSRTRPDGDKDTFWTVEVDAKEAPLWWQEKGLQFTASGYGRRIPTRHMVRWGSKWRRVYCCIFSNAGTCYIGKLQAVGENIIVQGIEP